MRRIIAFDRVSADGYFATPDGNLDWAVPEPDFEQGIARNMGTGGTMLFGRKTYDMFEAFWPKALEDPKTSPDPHVEGRRSEGLRAMAVWINEAEKLVFSRSRKEVTWKNSHLYGELDPRQIEALKAKSGSDIMIFGSSSVVSKLTEHGLVDEYHFLTTPVFLGGGRSLLTGLPKHAKVELLEAKPFPHGNVFLKYAPSR